VVRSSRSKVYHDGYEFLFERIGDPRSSALAVGKAFFEDVQGFDVQLEKHQDWDFALRCARRGPLLFGASTTVFLDERSADRMSSRVNIGASRMFLTKHADRMSIGHLSRFFATLLMAAAKQDGAEHRKAVALWREHLSVRVFPAKYWALLYFPRAGLFLMKTWLIFRRLQSAFRLHAVR
jgi:hypothetical protein